MLIPPSSLLARLDAMHAWAMETAPDYVTRSIRAAEADAMRFCFREVETAADFWAAMTGRFPELAITAS